MRGAEKDDLLETHSGDCQKTTAVQAEPLKYRKNVKTILQNAKMNNENK